MAYVDPTVACQPWTTPDKLCCEGGGDSIDCDGAVTPLEFRWSEEQVIAAATNLLFKRTCFRYPGLCERTVIPCICSRPVCMCGRREHAIELTSDYPIHEITEVVEVVDGVEAVLDASAYRLDEHRRLVRIDGQGWSKCWTDIKVSYTTGRMPPVELQMAAAELACELFKACRGTKCDLPPHVRSVTRRGVEHDIWDVVSLMSSGMTGLPMVDHALMVHGGPCRKSSMFDATRSSTAVRVG